MQREHSKVAIALAVAWGLVLAISGVAATRSNSQKLLDSIAAVCVVGGFFILMDQFMVRRNNGTPNQDFEVLAIAYVGAGSLVPLLPGLDVVSWLPYMFVVSAVVGFVYMLLR